MTASPELSVQLYTLREALEADADRTLGGWPSWGSGRSSRSGCPSAADRSSPGWPATT